MNLINPPVGLIFRQVLRGRAGFNLFSGLICCRASAAVPAQRETWELPGMTSPSQISKQTAVLTGEIRHLSFSLWGNQITQSVEMALPSAAGIILLESGDCFINQGFCPLSFNQLATIKCVLNIISLFFIGPWETSLLKTYVFFVCLFFFPGLFLRKE